MTRLRRTLRERDTLKVSENSNAAHFDSYSADAPLIDLSADEFHRLPFASRVAETIISRRDPTSIVFAVSGQYGAGKSTVLAFIRKKLEQHHDIVVVQFNPWRFASEEALLTAFFGALAQAIERRFTRVREGIGKVLADYVAVATELVKIKYQDVEVSAGEGIGKLGEKLKATTIEERKESIETLLGKEGKRIVIMIDDIDRLEPTEVHAVLRLVKLSADFPYTTYILAFDGEAVAKVIGRRFGADEAEGRSFLDKIIQVPLQLPKATHHDLVDFCLRRVESALKATGQDLSDEQSRDFNTHFLLQLAPRLETPRSAKRYANALSFAMPLLRGELNPIDVMLLEAIKVFYPATFRHLREAPSLYTGHYPYVELVGKDEREKLARQQILDASTLSGRELENLTQLLGRLFPQLADLWHTNRYGQTDRNDWMLQQRVARHSYLLRYLSWSVPGADYPDLELREFLDSLAELDESRAREAIRPLLHPDAFGAVFDKIVSHLPNLLGTVTRPLALALARNADLVEDTGHLMNPRDRAALLVRELIKRQKTAENRRSLAKEIANAGRPLPFAWTCWGYLSPVQGEAEQELVVDSASLTDLSKTLADRTAKEAEKVSLVETYPRDFRRLLHMWALHGEPGACHKWVRSLVKSTPSVAEKIIRQSFVTLGGPLGHDFKDKNYEDLSQIADPQDLYDALLHVYPQLKTSNYDSQGWKFDDQTLLAQFAAVHRARLTSGQLGGS
ncbi:MAG TPA: KAP family NTPase [Bryobacteraceae bacterium]|jgi:hypothetical protein